MAKPTRAVHEQKQVDAEELDFKVLGPQEVILGLEDGTTLKIFLIPAKVLKLRDIYNEEGEPIYQVRWGTAVSSSVPVSLLKPKDSPKTSN